MRKGFRTPKKQTKGQEQRAADRLDTALNPTAEEHAYVMDHTTNRVKIFKRLYRAYVYAPFKPTLAQVLTSMENVRFEIAWRR